jgi:hypothetical protein
VTVFTQPLKVTTALPAAALLSYQIADTGSHHPDEGRWLFRLPISSRLLLRYRPYFGRVDNRARRPRCLQNL